MWQHGGNFAVMCVTHAIVRVFLSIYFRGKFRNGKKRGRHLFIVLCQIMKVPRDVNLQSADNYVKFREHIVINK